VWRHARKGAALYVPVLGSARNLKITIRPQFVRLPGEFAHHLTRYSLFKRRGIFGMKKTFCAGALALAAIGLLSDLPASRADEFATLSVQSFERAASIDIGRIRNVLKLTPAQEPLWPPVEAALRDVARQQAHAETAGFVRRISRRVVSVVLNSVAVERLAIAARPLIAVLNDEQLRAASVLAQEMGLGPVVMAALK
jgi:hypothetical protein